MYLVLEPAPLLQYLAAIVVVKEKGETKTS